VTTTSLSLSPKSICSPVFPKNACRASITFSRPSNQPRAQDGRLMGAAIARILLHPPVCTAGQYICANRCLLDESISNLPGEEFFYYFICTSRLQKGCRGIRESGRRACALT